MLGLGTYKIPHPYDIVAAGIRAGYRLVDTAELYQNEAEVFAAVQDSGHRDQVFVMTKVRPGKRFHPDCDALLLHWPSESYEDDWRRLCEEKPVPHLGVSNFSREQLETIENIARPFCNQIEVTPFLPRTDLVAYHRENDIITVAHSPLTKGSRLDWEPLQRMATKYQCTPASVLLSWSLDQGFWVLPRTSQVSHLQENRRRISFDAADASEIRSWADGFATHPKYVEKFT